MIPTYNCAEFLEKAINSVLIQDLGASQMQIEVVDDCSNADNPREVVSRLGKDRVSFYRQKLNRGHLENFQTCLTRSRGHLIHLLHGDDAVRPGFYARIGEIFKENSSIGAAFTRHISIDANDVWQTVSPVEQSVSGIMPDLLQRLAVTQRIQTPSIVVKRAVYETLGTFDRRLNWTEDWEMWARISLNYPVWYELEPLALYRSRPGSNTNRMSRTGETARDVDRLFAIIQDYLPPKDRVLVNTGRRLHARLALRTAQDLARRGEIRGSVLQVIGALRLDRRAAFSPALLRYIRIALRHLASRNSGVEEPAIHQESAD